MCATRNAVLAALRFAWAAHLVRYARRRIRCPRAYRRLETTAAYALALRQSAQALVTVRLAGRATPRWLVLLDALHALSMIPVAMISKSLRGDAMRSGVTAALFALLSR